MYEERIFAEGFYDEAGIWFYTWEQGRDDERYSYALADAWDTQATHIRYSREGRVHGEITIAEYKEYGLPD